MKLDLKKGVDIPMSGAPHGPIQELPLFKKGALNLKQFPDLRFKLLVKIDDNVSIGQPLVENKAIPGQFFASPFGGKVVDIQRGAKRQLEAIVIDRDENESIHTLPPLSNAERSLENLLARLMESGVMPHIRMRPFNLIPDPRYLPRDIFIKGIETAPYTPPAEMQVEGYDFLFQSGIDVLKKLTKGSVYLVVKKGTPSRVFKEAKEVVLVEVSGPHPAGNASIHIHHIKPIEHIEDYVWTLSARDVVAVGKAVVEGRYHVDTVVGIAGDGVIEGKRGFFRTRQGTALSDLLEGRLKSSFSRIISGDPLMGQEEKTDGFLGFDSVALSVIPESQGREALHFFKLGKNKFSATRAYLSGIFPAPSSGYHFTTNQHGEERAFVDGSIYQRIFPMKVPVMELVKSILAEDYETSERLGLLEVAPEDFALPAFIDPCKIEMVDIVEQGLKRYSKEMGF